MCVAHCFGTFLSITPHWHFLYVWAFDLTGSLDGGRRSWRYCVRGKRNPHRRCPRRLKSETRYRCRKGCFGGCSVHGMLLLKYQRTSTTKVAEIQAVVHCIMEEKDRLQEAHREQLREAKQAMEGREQEVGQGQGEKDGLEIFYGCHV